MDTLFLLTEEDRTNTLQSLMQSLGNTYICLWSFLAPSNCLRCWDGYFQEENNQIARALFNNYRQQIFPINDHVVPGVAFRSNAPYMELHELDLVRTASIDVQRLFYQEAEIKTAVFMGCKIGEIELGWSNVTQIDVENKVKFVFQEDFSRAMPFARDSNPRTSSSSSSLRSVSNMDSPESSSFMYNIASSSHTIHETVQESTPMTLQPIIPITTTSHHQLQLQAINIQSLRPIVPTTTFCPITSSLDHQGLLQSLYLPIPATTSAISTPYQQAMQSFTLSRNVTLPTQESEDATMTRVFLAVLSSSSSSTATSSSFSPSTTTHRLNPRRGAFQSYRSTLGTIRPMRSGLQNMSMLRRAITYYTRLNIDRRGQMMMASAVNRPSSTQLHHMISERRRREKINESFQALRSLLPPETKKDKASVLTKTRDYLTTLKAQVEELSRKNQQLEAQLSQAKGGVKFVENQPITTTTLSSNQRFEIRITDVPESTSSQRFVDLQVVVRGDSPLDALVARLLEFVRQDRNVNVMSIDGRHRSQESNVFNHVVFRLKIEENEWDKSAFEEAIRRIVSDVAQ